jgi:DNA-binding response OmpR family regulator
VTAFNTKEGELRGLELGGIDYICKPIIFELLRMRVKNQLALKEHHDLISRQKEELEATLSRIKHLEGIVTICVYCKSIQNEKEDWERLEKYIEGHSDAEFSHGMCPACKQEKFPQYSDK